MTRTTKISCDVTREADNMLKAYCKKHERSKGYLIEKMIRKFCDEVEVITKPIKTAKEVFDFSLWPNEPSKKIFADMVKARKQKHKVGMSQAYINSAAKHLHELVGHDISVDQVMEIGRVTMKLIGLKIKLNEYGRNKGKYTGVAEFTDKAGDIALNLDAEACERIFEVCADGVLTVAKEAASNLTCNVLEHIKSIKEAE